MMTEKEAWLFIADAFDKPKSKEPYWNFTHNGLCWSVNCLYTEHLIGVETYNKIGNTVDKYREDHCLYTEHFWPTHNESDPRNNEYRKNRAELARQFAEKL